MPTAATLKRNKFLTITHPVYDECVEEWTRNEKLYIGGPTVVDEELIRFDWEKIDGERARARKATAVYLNYSERYCDITTGHIFRQRPTPEDTLDFGGLGEVPRTRNQRTPSPAELIYYNADGLGRDGSQWDGYWQAVTNMAIVTGHRWVYVEGPPEAPKNRQEELNGKRPYLTDYSPRAVTNWHYENGQLAFAVIRRSMRKPRIVRGVFSGNLPTIEYLLLTREGFVDFGEAYAGGGWFRFDAEGELDDFDIGWDATNGEIPLTALYYQRIRPQENMLRISRSGVTEIGNAAVLDMNMRSAADWDLWDTAGSAIALTGVDRDGYNLFMEIVRGGSRYAPLPTNEDTKRAPGVADIAMGATVAQAFATRIGQNKEYILELMMNEMQVSPDASGAARRTTWTDVRAPRLAGLAANVETTQNTVLPWLEGFWGEAAPSASTAWPREFDLIDPIAAGSLFFEMEATSGMKSATLGRKILVSAAKSSGFLGDDAEQKKVEAEYDESAKKAQAALDTAAQLGALMGGSRNNPGNQPRRSNVPTGDGRRRQNQPKRTPGSNTPTK